MITAEIVKVDQDGNGALRIWTSYSSDGVEQVSTYPKVDGRNVFPSVFSSVNLTLKSVEDLKSAILSQAQKYVEANIQNEYLRKSNAEKIKQLGSLVGEIISSDSLEISISETEKVTIKDDGTNGAISSKLIG